MCIEVARSLGTDVGHPHLVVLGSESEVSLQFIAARLEAFGIQYRPFYEPDLADSLTALATEPLSGSRRKPLQRYRCWSAPSETQHLHEKTKTTHTEKQS